MANPYSEPATGTLLLAIVANFIVASSITVYPLGSSLAELRPMPMIMVLIFWLLFQPRYVGVLIAFGIGIVSDLLMDTRLGQQAFAAVVVALTMRVCSLYFKQLTLSSAWLMASIGLSVFQMTLWLLQIITQTLVVSSWYALLMSIATWPLILLVLRRYTRFVTG